MKLWINEGGTKTGVMQQYEKVLSVSYENQRHARMGQKSLFKLDDPPTHVSK